MQIINKQVHRHPRRRTRLGVALLGALMLVGCYTTPKAPLIPSASYTGYDNNTPQPIYDGTLYRTNAPMNNLFADFKARRLGDIVTIKIAESSKASNKAKTDTKRESSLTAQLENMWGLENRYDTNSPYYQEKYADAPLRLLNPYGKVKGAMANEFKGDGNTERSGDLSAHVAARVVEVLPNGNLRIAGSREVILNQESQMIVMTGIVRPRDISADNVVVSTYVADAQIFYTGAGSVNDTQKPGWLMRILNGVWPL